MALDNLTINPLVFDLRQVDSVFAFDSTNECHSNVYDIHYKLKVQIKFLKKVSDRMLRGNRAADGFSVRLDKRSV